MFAAYFKSTYNQQSSIQLTNHVRNNHNQSQNPIIISPNEVSNIIKNLDLNKNGGPDHIPNIFLRNTIHQISILNKSLDSGVFPDDFKSAYIASIHKNGDNSFISNYRPISMINTIALVFEKLVLNH